MSSHPIDLNPVEQSTSSSSSFIINEQEQQQQGYQPTTLKSHNRARSVYLPLFPTKSFGPNDYLLLANVPVTRLAPHEIAKRQYGAYTSDALMMMNNYDYSNDGFSLSQQDVEELAARLRVGKSIITFNAQQLRGICYTLLTLHESFRRNILQIKNVALTETTLNSKQMAIALEFYLQIDVDLFYMKTCSYRGAMPRFKNIEGLFCGNDEPEARYTLTPCASLLCPYCYPSNHWQKSQPWPVIDFASSSKYQFVNGYITYLNCPATCKTSNIIYAMTCPCGHYDYVDSTTQTLADAMTYHRKHGNRIIFEKLIGSPLFSGSLLDPYEKEQETANKMRLYQHSARCPIALRSFLECNPNYWCFIPMLLHEALAENILYTRTSNYSTAELYDFIPMIAIDNQRVENYLSHIPLSPVSYAFSYQQRQKQRLFFESIVPFSTNEQSLPYSPLHLYKVALIVVLPDDCSMILRYILQSLFIVHGEPKLNMICPLGGDPEKRYGRAYDLVWCAGLNHSLLTMPRSNQD